MNDTEKKNSYFEIKKKVFEISAHLSKEIVQLIS